MSKGVLIKEGLFGWMNTSFEQKIPCEFEDIRAWANSKYIRVKKDGFWGMFDANGDLLLPFKYDEISIRRNDCFASLGLKRFDEGTTAPMDYGFYSFDGLLLFFIGYGFAL